MFMNFNWIALVLLMASSPSFADDAQATASDVWSAPTDFQWAMSKESGGQPVDVVNIYVHGTQPDRAKSLADLKAAFEAECWMEAYPNNLLHDVEYPLLVPVFWLDVGARTLARKISKGFHKLFHWKRVKSPIKPDPIMRAEDKMPLSTSYVEGMAPVAEFELGNDPAGGRDHFRVFDTGANDENGLPIFGIAASWDAGIGFDIHEPERFFLTHKINHKEDIEKRWVKDFLKWAGAIDLNRIEEHDLASAQNDDPSPVSGGYELDHKVYDLYMIPPGSSGKYVSPEGGCDLYIQNLAHDPDKIKTQKIGD